jgi:tetratricopeptide (TPR) repeat protein
MQPHPRPLSDLAEQALILYTQKHFKEALQIVHPASLRPGCDTKILDVAASCSYWLKRDKEAETYWRQALRIDPEFTPRCFNPALFYERQKNYVEAEKWFHALLARAPSPDRHNDFANMLHNLKRYDEAEAHYRNAINMRPDFNIAWNNLGILYARQHRWREAETIFKRSLELRPQNANIYGDLGNVYMEMNRYDEAEALYRKHLALKPDAVRAERHLSYLYLVTGDFDRGWPLGELRYHPALENPDYGATSFPFPFWRGEPAAGKSLLIMYEQGFGDIIQFARYVPILKKLGASRIGIVVKKPLMSLMQTLKGIDRVIEMQPQITLERYDYWTYPLSIPLHLETRLDNIPSEMHYLSVPPEAQQKWQHKIPSKGFKVGLVWKGSTDHRADIKRSLKSITLLRPLWDVPGVTFISLQKGQGEIEATHPPASQPMHDLGTQMQDFSDAAALVEQMDLIICVDTAIAHLGGVLGKKVWVLVSFAPDWRWMMDREDSPWYPTLRLFRQDRLGDWTGVITRMRDELAKLIKGTQL